MASADKTKTTAELAAEEQAAIEAAVTPAEPVAPTAGRDAATASAREAELHRQATVKKAVAEANKSELPKLGGPLMEPGLGR